MYNIVPLVYFSINICTKHHMSYTLVKITLGVVTKAILHWTFHELLMQRYRYIKTRKPFIQKNDKEIIKEIMISYCYNSVIR